MSPTTTSDRAVGKRKQRASLDRKVRVHRISSRYPAIEIRTRMDSYGTLVRQSPHEMEDDHKGDHGDDCGDQVKDEEKDGEKIEEREKEDDVDGEDDDDDDDDDDDNQSKTSAAGCSSASDTDFYYRDCHGTTHMTVVEIRAEEVETRTETVQEEFEDSLITTVDDLRLQRDRHRTTEIVTKHRHVLAESCRVKVQNLR